MKNRELIEAAAKEFEKLSDSIPTCDHKCDTCKYKKYKEQFFCTTIQVTEAIINKANYRKQQDTVKRFVKKLKETDNLCRKKYSEGIGFTEINKIAKEFGVEEDL